MITELDEGEYLLYWLACLFRSIYTINRVLPNYRLLHECADGPFEYLRPHPAWQ